MDGNDESLSVRNPCTPLQAEGKSLYQSHRNLCKMDISDDIAELKKIKDEYQQKIASIERSIDEKIQAISNPDQRSVITSYREALLDNKESFRWRTYYHSDISKHMKTGEELGFNMSYEEFRAFGDYHAEIVFKW